MLGRKTLLWMLILWSTGCGELDALSSKESRSDKPYTLSILSQQTCPLTDGLDPKKVVILSFRVKLEGRAPQGVPANYFYASLLMEDGERYLAEYAGCHPVLSDDPLPPGESTTGFLNFPVPPSKVAKTLEFAPDILNIERDESMVQLPLSENDLDDESAIESRSTE